MNTGAPGMWRRAGLLAFGALSLGSCLLLSAAMLLLGARFLSDLALLRRSPWGLYTVLVAVLATGLVFVTLASLQFAYLLYTRAAERGEASEVERWGGELSEYALFGSPPTRPLDRVGADALLELRSNLSGEESRRLAALYAEQGWLARDLAALRSRRADARAGAIERMGLLAHPDTFGALDGAARDRASDTRQLALLALARALGQSGASGAEAARWLLPHLNTERFGTGQVRAALVLLGDAADEVLAALLGSARPAARLTALRVIGAARRGAFAPQVLELLDSADPDVLAGALRTLAALGELPGAAEVRARALARHDAWFVRAQAVLALGRADNPPLGVLLECLGDANWWVRRNSALALVELGAAGRGALRAAASDHPDRFARDMAQQMLEWPRPAGSAA